jgi:hypothetical protein
MFETSLLKSETTEWVHVIYTFCIIVPEVPLPIELRDLVVWTVFMIYMLSTMALWVHFHNMVHKNSRIHIWNNRLHLIFVLSGNFTCVH